jgi:cytochrome c-type biogenesis protein CcmH/NrfG
MKMTQQQGWKIAGGILLLTMAFVLGYFTGSRSPKSVIEAPANLTAKDMEHAFGSVKQAELEPIKQDAMANSLSSLVAGLEKKVAENPENLDQQLLLAQTYNELDHRSKSLDLLHALNRKAAKNSQVKITLASVLMKGADPEELKEALRVFDEAIKLDPEIATMARMYQSEIRGKLGLSAKK